jgi:hypothetical protein
MSTATRLLDLDAFHDQIVCTERHQIIPAHSGRLHIEVEQPEKRLHGRRLGSENRRQTEAKTN